MILLKIFHSVTPSTRLPSGKVGKTSSADRKPDFAVSIHGNSSMKTIFRRKEDAATTSRKARNASIQFLGALPAKPADDNDSRKCASC